LKPISKETVKRTRKPDGWSALRQHLTTMEKPELLALVKDLYELSASNGDFIQARCQTGENSGEILEKYRGKIVEQFYPRRGEAKLQLSEARQAITEYRKATSNLQGTADLLMTYVEQGAEFTHDYGDIDERFYDSVESTLKELANLLLQEPELYPQFNERLARVEELTRGIGWGFSDYVADVVWQLDDELGDK
jgi:hypothetical protein